MSTNSGEETSDPLGEVGKAVGVLRTIMEIAEKTPELKKAGTNLAKAAQTVTALVNNCLLPIAAVNFAFEKGRKYFEEKFGEDLQAITSDIPTENLVEPRASVAAPILQGLTFSHDEASLKEMFLHLLRSSMDSRTRSIAHPAFAEVIRQLEATEAMLLKIILMQDVPSPIVQIRQEINEKKEFNILSNHLLNFYNRHTKELLQFESSAAMVDNWIRLGLVTVSYDEHLASPSFYDWVESRPEFAEMAARGLEGRIVFQKGLLRASSFGAQFRRAVLS